MDRKEVFNNILFRISATFDHLLKMKAKQVQSKDQPFKQWAQIQFPAAIILTFIGSLISFAYPNRILAILNTSLSFSLFILTFFKVSENCLFRLFLCIAASVPAMLSAPTAIGALCMICCGLTYLKACWNKEW